MVHPGLNFNIYIYKIFINYIDKYNLFLYFKTNVKIMQPVHVHRSNQFKLTQIVKISQD